MPLEQTGLLKKEKEKKKNNNVRKELEKAAPCERKSRETGEGASSQEQSPR